MFSNNKAKSACQSYADVVKKNAPRHGKECVNEPKVEFRTQDNKTKNKACSKGVNVSHMTKSHIQVDTSAAKKADTRKTRLLYDVNENKSDKFINSILFQNNEKGFSQKGKECSSYLKFREQSEFDFGFIPLTEPMCYKGKVVNTESVECPIELYHKVANTKVANYMEARIHIVSQLNISFWRQQLVGYWDSQLLDLLQYGFPLGYNRHCKLKNDMTNHKSAVDFPDDVQAYIDEERRHGAILGPFQMHPLENAHFSPFMTRHNPIPKIGAS